jgi:magnesium chelatase subunit I
VVPRVGDIYAALPGITGKLELEYEGEMRGADTVVREICARRSGRSSTGISPTTNTQQIEQWFNLGGTVKIERCAGLRRRLAGGAEADSGLVEKLAPLTSVNAKTGRRSR